MLPAGRTPTGHVAFAPVQNAYNPSAFFQHVGRGKTAIRYLARYVKRSAIGPRRLIGYDKHGNIRLHWTSSDTRLRQGHGGQAGKSGILTLTPHEFIRRWLIHVLPKGFARVRHYGFMSAAACRTLQTIRLHLGADPKPTPDLPEPAPHPCPNCGGNLTFLREPKRSGDRQERTRRARRVRQSRINSHPSTSCAARP